MTKERHYKIQDLITKLKECEKTCDEFYTDEDGQSYDMLSDGCKIASEKCQSNIKKLIDAELIIEDAIETLEGIEL